MAFKVGETLLINVEEQEGIPIGPPVYYAAEIVHTTGNYVTVDWHDNEAPKTYNILSDKQILLGTTVQKVEWLTHIPTARAKALVANESERRRPVIPKQTRNITHIEPAVKPHTVSVQHEDLAFDCEDLAQKVRYLYQKAGKDYTIPSIKTSLEEIVGRLI